MPLTNNITLDFIKKEEFKGITIENILDTLTNPNINIHNSRKINLTRYLRFCISAAIKKRWRNIHEVWKLLEILHEHLLFLEFNNPHQASDSEYHSCESGSDCSDLVTITLNLKHLNIKSK